jgi:hypothetical protein
LTNPEKIGVFSAAVVELLALDVPAGTEIYIGETNLQHMRRRHPEEYSKYYPRINKIIETPDFVGINPSDGSIEFIKSFGKHIKVAVRIANDGEYYVRSLYSITPKRLEEWVKDGKLLPLDKPKEP